MGPVTLVVGRPFREWIGDEIPKAIPQSYPGKYKITAFGNGRVWDVESLRRGHGLGRLTREDEAECANGYSA
jgi:hypothetical protein